MPTDVGWIEGAAAHYEAQLERNAQCHYGDHEYVGAVCDNCGHFNAALLSWLRAEKADREGRHHGNHFHNTVEAAARCERPTHDEQACAAGGGCLHHEADEAFIRALTFAEPSDG